MYSLSRRFKENEGKSIFLKCIITYVFHCHVLLWSPKEENRCEVGLDGHGRKIPGDPEHN